ncbi:amidase [Tothia fuscella]|uniref:amidase n=1 Tax=Tothia fuscella TaxID=1048955 RepID=A0A9P4P4H2_9PEZI|nr:amidase [Tothia fuscella]
MPPPFKQLSTWQETAKQMRDHRDSTLAALESPIPGLPVQLPLNVTHLAKEILTEEEIKLTESLPETLMAELATGALTSTKVTKAFLRRAALAQKLTNCVTELLPERALKRAAELDTYFAQNKKPIGSLHGLPISVKEHIGMKDLDLNAGFVSWVGNTAKADAVILQILWSAGAVFYVRTTQPQSLMHLETSSNLYGETVNPYNTKLTSGGSSGGEGALLGFNGSCLGIGTDIGGSIRSPAANNGVYGLRPTSFRLPNAGCLATMLYEEHVIPVIGPLSTSLEGIRLFTKTIIDAQPWLKQANLLPLPWKEGDLREKDASGKTTLRVGVMWDDEIVKPHPPVLRALKKVVDKLKEIEGVELIDWKPYKHDLAWEIIASLYFADGALEDKVAIAASGEPYRPLTNFIINDNPYVKELTITELWAWTAKRDKYREEYMNLWNSTANDGKRPIDVILCPVGPGAAPPLNCAHYWAYTSQWNLLDYPALVFPVTQVDPLIDLKEERYQPRNEKDAYNYELYERERYRDAPVSLQLVGRRFDDEKIIQVLDFIQQHVKLPFQK